MLDENLPTFHFKPSSDNPLNTVLYFTQRGDEAVPEYILKRADPTLPQSRNKYAVALADPFASDVLYAECLVEPEWTQPSLSAAEQRAQQGPNPQAVPVTPSVPGEVGLQLYNPDHMIAIKLIPSSWNKTESWEFEMPTQSFRMPSVSEIDRQQSASPAQADLVPKIMFRWRKDGRLSKDMTCYMTGKSVGGSKSKEPDITIALFKNGKDSAVTVYEPNLQRVDVEDRKGLEIALILSAEVIRDLYISPRPDVFNLTGAPPTHRKNSKPLSGPAATPSPPPAAGNGPAMSGAIIPPIPGRTAASPAVQPPPGPPPNRMGNLPPASTGGKGAPSAAAVEAETRRLQAMQEQENREREKAEREREKRDKAEQKRIKKMLEDEEKERARREAEVAKETERLRKQYGYKGSDAVASPSPGPPQLPQRPGQGPPPLQQQQPAPQPGPFGGGGPGWWGGTAPPPRPSSAAPSPGSRPHAQTGPSVPPPNASGGGPFNNSSLNSWWGGPSSGGQQIQINPPKESRFKLHKKRSMHW
jgi:hypothetical protein